MYTGDARPYILGGGFHFEAAARIPSSSSLSSDKDMVGLSPQAVTVARGLPPIAHGDGFGAAMSEPTPLENAISESLGGMEAGQPSVMPPSTIGGYVYVLSPQRSSVLHTGVLFTAQMADGSTTPMSDWNLRHRWPSRRHHRCTTPWPTGCSATPSLGTSAPRKRRRSPCSTARPSGRIHQELPGGVPALAGDRVPRRPG